MDTGNFIISNATDTVWQSFDSPTDTLLPTQYFTKKNNVTMYSTKTEAPWIGTDYIMNWDNNSISISWLSSYCDDANEPYYWNSNTTIQTSSTTRAFSYVELTTQGELIMVYEDSQSPADYALISQSNDTLLEGPLRRLTLDPDGNLRMYSWYIGSSTIWTPVWTAVSDVCNIFGYCGPFAWCNNGLCICPQGFTPIDPTNTVLGCERTTPLTCNTTQHVDIVPLQSVDYPYGTSDYALYSNNVSATECIAKCLAFCLCQAVAVSVTTSSDNVSCWLKKDVLINGRYDGTRITYFKVPQISKKSGLPIKVILTLIIFVLGTIAIILGLISCTLGYMFICKKIKVFQLKNLETRWNVAHGTIIKLSSQEVKLMTNNFEEEIGKGGYGTVFKGEVGGYTTTKKIVAVKRLDKLNVEEKEFIDEVDIIGHIHHANLVHLLGYCSKQHQRTIIYEYMENHSLNKFLFQNQKSRTFTLDWRIRFNIAIQIANGLAYLHNDLRKQRIIHCDVKPENILLDSTFSAKVADFGMSRIMDQNQTQTMTRHIRGTLGYLAPEWTCDQIPITTKADVYSYGMVLLEIVSGRRNLKSTSNHTTDDWYFPLWAYSKIDTIENMFELLDPLLCGLANPLELKRVLRVAFWCINDQPHVRPSMSTVVQMLEGNMPIELPVPQPKFLLDMITASTEEDDENIREMFKTTIETSELREYLKMI